MNYPLYIIVLAVVFAASWLIQFILQLSINHRVFRRCKAEIHMKKVSFAEAKPGVSVIVYAHNQGEALMHNLPILLNNDYPDFEVIVVDDMSNDDTQDVLTILEQRSERLYHTKLTDKVRTMSHRKLALLLGVKGAHCDIILTTKAQCVPASKNWISSMVRNFTERTDFVLGPVAFENRTGLVSRFYQYDLFQRMVSLFGLTMSICPFAGWGNNMAFRKHLLFDDNNKAFSSHLNIHPGEDDLFVAAMSRRGNVAVECTPDSMIIDQETPVKKAWSKDRLNRAFTGKRYAFAPKFIKRLDYLTRYLCVLPGLALAVLAAITFDWIPLSVVLSLLVLRMILNSTTAYLTSKALGIRRYLFSPIFYDLWIPIVDLWYRMRASVGTRSFYVGRV